jgi:IMP dehydrogenase
MSLMAVTIADLAQEPIRQSRAHLDPERVAYYEEHLDDATPVVVYDIHGHLLLADGYHRVAAAQRLGRSSIRADVHSGERGDALRFAVEFAQKQRGLTEQQAVDAIMHRQQPSEQPD